MRVLLAVAEDLYFFALSSLSGLLPRQDRTQPQPQQLPPKAAYRLLTEPRTAPAQRHVPSADVTPGLPQKHTIVYCAEVDIPLRLAPDDTIDTAIAKLEYGDMVMVLDATPSWTFVAVHDKKGYVPTTALVDTAARVYPEFVSGGHNGPRDANTLRLRAVIADEFSARLSQLPIQPHEYAYYKLVRRGITIPWPDIRPRTAGSWATILRDCDAVARAHEPSVGSIMEYVSSDGTGHLCYVERCYPDRSILVSEVHTPEQGIYDEQTLTSDEWGALNPAFLTFSS